MARSRLFSRNTISGEVFNTTSSDAWGDDVNDTQFGILIVQDADNSLDSDIPTLTTGDVALLTINLTAVFGGVEPRTPISIKVVPEVGAPGFAKVVTPTAYGLSDTDRIVELK